MPQTDTKYRIFISAAEPSADAHCAALIIALKQRSYDIEFVGVGGPKMAAAGCKLLETTVGRAAMAYQAFRQVAYFYGLINRVSSFLQSTKVDLVIVCDSPAFNFHVAKSAKKAAIKTLFYIAPQLWAWVPWRIGKLRKTCYKLCCALPFEEEWFRQRGVATVFVGNPMLDGLHISASNCRSYSDFKPQEAHIALLPGSRKGEIETLWQPMQQIAILLKSKYPDMRFTTVAADEEKRQHLAAAELTGFKSSYAIDAVADVAAKANFAITASGSVTLELAAAGCPMVVMYQSSRLLWHLLGRWLVRAKNLSLVNILCGRELVPEFMPYFSSIEPILEEVENLLSDRERLTKISRGLVEAVVPLAAKKASEEVADIVLDMLR
jgi:lipid-A-disaccharide synthase